MLMVNGASLFLSRVWHFLNYEFNFLLMTNREDDDKNKMSVYVDCKSQRWRRRHSCKTFCVGIIFFSDAFIFFIYCELRRLCKIRTNSPTKQSSKNVAKVSYS
jgi:hypothetical protein